MEKEVGIDLLFYDVGEKEPYLSTYSLIDEKGNQYLPNRRKQKFEDIKTIRKLLVVLNTIPPDAELARIDCRRHLFWHVKKYLS